MGAGALSMRGRKGEGPPWQWGAGGRGARQGGGFIAEAYQWASAAAFCDVATPSQGVGHPPLDPKAPQGFVGSLAQRSQK